jgi:hypothetical protein
MTKAKKYYLALDKKNPNAPQYWGLGAYGKTHPLFAVFGHHSDGWIRIYSRSEKGVDDHLAKNPDNEQLRRTKTEFNDEQSRRADTELSHGGMIRFVYSEGIYGVKVPPGAPLFYGKPYTGILLLSDPIDYYKIVAVGTLMRTVNPDTKVEKVSFGGVVINPMENVENYRLPVDPKKFPSLEPEGEGPTRKTRKRVHGKHFKR